jgi:hypothetical protein
MKKMKKVSLFLVFTLLVGVLFMQPLNVDAKTKAKTKLSTTKTTVYKGDTKTIKLKNNTKKVKWSVSNKNIVKIVKKSNKQVKIKAMNAGTTYVKAKVGKKTYKCKVVVKNLSVKQTILREFKKQIEKNGAIISTEYAPKEDIKEFGPTLGMGYGGTNVTANNYKESAKQVGEWYKINGFKVYYLEIIDNGDGTFVVLSYYG